MVDVNIKNFLIVGLLAILFIIMAKVIFTKWQVKGVSEVVQAV